MSAGQCGFIESYRCRVSGLGNKGVVERLKHRLDHTVEFIRANLLWRSIVSQFCSGLLLPCSRLQRCLLQKKFLKIVRRIEISLLA